MTTTDQALRQLEVPAITHLFELDYGKLVGNPLGTPASMFFFTPGRGAQFDRQLAGIAYTAVPARLRNVERRGTGPQARPTLEVANTAFLITQILDDIVGGDLRGATITMKTIFSRHLDDGDDPDPLRVWEPVQRWILFRKVRDDSDSIEFQLATPIDIAVRVPSSTVQSTICPWAYRKGGDGGKDSRCTWDPAIEGLFIDKNNLPSTLAEDECALTVAACKLRFAAQGRPLRFGGYPAAGRAVR